MDESNDEEIADIIKTINELPIDETYALGQYILNLGESTVSNIIETIPKGLSTALELVDPTGKISILFSHIRENKAEKERQRILYAVAWLIKRSRLISRILDPNNEHDVELSVIYLERCKETYQLRKIKIFSNILINSLINREHNINEKAYIFNLASSLMLEELFVLGIVYSQTHQISSIERVAGSTDQMKDPSTSIDQIAEKLNIEIDYAQQLCIRLQSMGLLYPANITVADMCGLKLPSTYAMSNYVKTFVKYIIDPDLENNSSTQPS